MNASSFPKGPEAWATFDLGSEETWDEETFESRCTSDQAQVYEEGSVQDMQGATAGVSSTYVSQAPVPYDGSDQSAGEYVSMEIV